MHITLAENFRAIFYTPFYLLKELRLAEEVGLDIEWLAPGTPGGAIDQIKAGTIDLTWGGPMRVMKDRDTTPINGASLLCFSEVVSRDPFFLIGSDSQFALTALDRLRMSLVSEVPTPWLCLQQDLRDAGLDVEQLEQSSLLKRGLTMVDQIQALENKEVDVIQLFEPLVSEVLAQSKYKILYAAHSRGPTVYTTLISSQDSFTKKQTAFVQLNTALGRVQQWMHGQPAQVIAERVDHYFPELKREILVSAIKRYLDNQVWASTPEISKSGFNRLVQSLHSGGFIQTPAHFDSCVKIFS